MYDAEEDYDIEPERIDRAAQNIGKMNGKCMTRQTRKPDSQEDYMQ